MGEMLAQKHVKASGCDDTDTMHAKIFGSVLVAYSRAHRHAWVGSKRRHGSDRIQTRRLLLSSTLSPPDITLLSNSKLDTFALWQRYPGLGALPNDENVGNTDEDVSTAPQGLTE